MVSVEEIQKANHLSKELKKHGFANDMGEAYSQAESIFDKSKDSPQLGFAEPVVVEKKDEYIEELLQRIKLLERHKDFSQRKEAELRQQISQLTQSFNEVSRSLKLLEMNQQSFKTTLDRMKSSPPVQQPAPQPVQAAPEPVQQTIPDNTRQESTIDNTRHMTEPIDASGIAPADVAVEKIFYVGQK
ncbi:hypothetical protein ACFL1B_03090 [Nanoarchaeota archaeon]